MHPRRPVPWFTALIVLLTLLAWFFPVVSGMLIFDRTAILHGQIWRLWTGHVCHFSGSHLLWDLLATALASAWIEMAAFPGRRCLWLMAPPFISVALLLSEPALQFYGGLSGLATAGMTFACLGELRRPDSNRRFWQIILALVAVKTGWEFFSGETLFARFGSAPVRAVPLSHAAGAAAALWVAAIYRRRNLPIKYFSQFCGQPPRHRTCGDPTP